MAHAAHNDIRLRAEGERLLVDAPKGALTSEFSTVLKTHKADLLAVLSKGVDWNDHPDTPPTDPFTREAIQDIKAGKAVPVWSSVLEEWLWFVRDSDAQKKLIAQGCQSSIFTLGELAIVVDGKLGSDGLKHVHAIKKKFAAAIEWPPQETQ
jgi:hypothetical protein